jgi:hypothetical protein
LTLLAAASPAAARLHDPEALPEVRIQDLPYGDVLFYYYQGKDFEAATRLLAYNQWRELPHHAADAKLVLAGLYLSLGMYARADQSFEELLTSDVPTRVRDRGAGSDPHQRADVAPARVAAGAAARQRVDA